MSDAPLRGKISNFLAAHNTLTLATVDVTGQPHAAALFYASTPELHLIVLSAPDTAHARHMAAGAPVAITIQADGQNWQHITGLQLHGIAALSQTPADRDLYLQKFPFITRTETLVRTLKKVQFYRITPHWIRLIDNRLGFGHHQEFIIKS